MYLEEEIFRIMLHDLTTFSDSDGDVDDELSSPAIDQLNSSHQYVFFILPQMKRVFQTNNKHLFCHMFICSSVEGSDKYLRKDSSL
jgi:hypothetical protein